jgi:hypothetical protein
LNAAVLKIPPLFFSISQQNGARHRFVDLLRAYCQGTVPQVLRGQFFITKVDCRN